VHTLTLSHCSGISDVSALGGVHTLDVNRCPGLRDVSALGGVHTLDLTCDFHAEDVSYFWEKYMH
jgi:hypothetical protein